MSKPPRYEVKDSGERLEFEGGMVRDTASDKIDYSLAFDGPLIERYATHLTRATEKYPARNWMKAAGDEEKARFRESAVRHFIQWLRGDGDEDHFAATIFNMNGFEYVTQPASVTPDDLPATTLRHTFPRMGRKL